MAHLMTPGEAAFYRKNHNRHWNSLTDAERDNWERGAALPAVHGTLRLVQGPDVKNG